MKSGSKKLKIFIAFVIILVLVLTVIMLAVGLPFATVPAKPEGEDSIEGYYTYTVENSKATITDCDTSISGDIAIPDTLGGYPVTNIEDEAFSDCTGLTSITMPDSVTSIGPAAFSDCTGLTKLTIGNSVTSIGGYAFYYCTGLTSITIPDRVTSIGNNAFYGCTGLTEMSVASGNSVYHSKGNCIIETASKKLIAGCKTSVIPSDGSVTSIGSHAFIYCTGLTA